MACAGTGPFIPRAAFVLGIDAKRLDPDLPEGEKVLIQGIIDVFFIVRR